MGFDFSTMTPIWDPQKEDSGSGSGSGSWYQYEGVTETTSIPLDILYSGQYHEVNPGQYHETNPGQYNPGQYSNLETNYSEDYEVNNVKVDFEHEDNHKTYTVEARAGDFFIGEVGKIDVSNGQTLEGVRYTAVIDGVPQRRISQILERFFGSRS